MEKSKRKFKIGGVGLDCSTLPYRPAYTYLPDYLYIDTSANNIGLVEDMLENKSVIVRVGTSGVGMLDILRGTGLTEIDVLLLPASSPIDLEELKKVLDELEIGCVGIDRPENLTQCREAAEEIKKVILPTYVSLSINPVHFQKDIVDWAEENEIDILGLDPFGGFLSAPSVIQSFTIPFLLTFTAAYSKIVFLSGRDIINAYNNSRFLTALIDGEVEEELVKMSKSVDHLVKPLPKLVHSGLRLGDEGIVPYEDPEALINPGEVVLKLDRVEWKGGEEEDEIVKQILDFDLLTMPLPENVDTGTKISIILPSLISELKKATGCKIEAAKMGTATFLISLEEEKREKRYLWKDKKWVEKKYYIFHMTETGEIKVGKWKDE
jgi:hypothetical protein